jgi:hypothetical protein
MPRWPKKEEVKMDQAPAAALAVSVAPDLILQKAVSLISVLKMSVLPEIDRMILDDGHDMRRVAARNGVVKAIKWLEKIEEAQNERAR